ncbi:MAG: class I SAM-dependent RNA methyltransferase [Clostridia bacterium]|nr:class I SAM-dependent RNA methyltransferase [Clostridia bacterium]MBQ9774260.1 class I SAM-dependent RNA methyltransferase [Clostridia bacterium]
MKLELVATCLFGLEKLLGEEIDALGLKRLDTMDGRVTFEGELRDIPRANLSLRCAEHVFIKLAAFPATTFSELFDGVRAISWEDWIGKLDAFPVKGHAIKSKLYSVPDCQSIIKKAAVERLGAHYGVKWFAESGTKYQIEFFLFKDVATLMLDTSGIPLHKRGYRPAAGPAPLRETLAAALALTARPREEILFWDPMCGSGTIAIEAALILSNRAPGLGRSFAAEEFAQIPASLWKDAREAAEAAIKVDSPYEVYASDIDEDMLDVVYENALRAGVEEHLNIFQADVRNIQKPAPDRRGTIVCNPPYGERLMTPAEAEALYRDMGRAFADLSPWQIYIITSHPQFERFYGARADKIRKLYNGMIPCHLYQYFKPKR